MAGKFTHRPEADLSETDRIRLATARQTVKELGGDMPEPLSEIGYEQRVARIKALELANDHENGADAILGRATEFYRFIWEGPDA